MAKGHQIFFAVISAFCQGFDVMHLLRFSKLSFDQALLAKRVCMNIAIPDTFPCASVPALCSRVSVVLFVAFGLQLLVFLAEPPVR